MAISRQRAVWAGSSPQSDTSSPKGPPRFVGVFTARDIGAIAEAAKAAGVAIAGAGWANDVPQIEAFMKENRDFYFKEVAQLQAFLFGP